MSAAQTHGLGPVDLVHQRLRGAIRRNNSSIRWHGRDRRHACVQKRPYLQWLRHPNIILRRFPSSPLFDLHQYREELSRLNSPKRLFFVLLSPSEWEAVKTISCEIPRGGWSSQKDAATESRSSNMKAVIEAFEELKALPVSAAILDASGTVVAVNDAWKDFGRRNGLRIPNSGIASNYLKYCESGEPHSSDFLEDLRELLAGRLDLLTHIYPCHSLSEKRWFCMIGLPLSLHEPAGVALLHVNLTEMLSLPIGARPIKLKTSRTEQIRTTGRLDKISDAIERSVSKTLSSQLNAMLTGNDRGSAQDKTSARRVPEHMLAQPRLSKRQMQVLRLLGKGKTNKEIADLLFRSPNTIKLHVSAILRQLKLKSRTQAALLASRLNKEESIDVAGGDTKTWKKAHTPLAQHEHNGLPSRSGGARQAWQMVAEEEVSG